MTLGRAATSSGVTTSVDNMYGVVYLLFMAPIKSDQFEYSFRPQSIEALRKQLGLTQAGLAEELDVPVNTVSRWETGATTPDAKALAALYSVAKGQGVNPQFFQRRVEVTKKQQDRTKLMVAWDFQNLGFDANSVETEWYFAKGYLDLMFPKTRANRLLLAYASPHQREAVKKLEGQKFQTREGFFDADSQIINDAKEYCLKNPSKTVLVLATNDGGFGKMLGELNDAGVDCYVSGTDKCSDRLKKVVDNDHFIHWDKPFVVKKCVDVIEELKGNPISKGAFGQRCQERLEESGFSPVDVGFGKNHPYSRVLRWLELQGLVSIKETTGKKDEISIKLA